MPHTKHIVGWKEGIKYTLVYDQRGNQQACDVQRASAWCWFLWVRDVFVGSFGAKKDALNHIN